MKTSLPATLLFTFLLGAFTNSFAINYNNYGTSTNYNLVNGDTLRIVSGTYQGAIQGFHSNAVILISENGTFKPSSINSPYGNIINYGTCILNFTFNPSSNLRISNYSIFQVNGSATANGGNQVWTNNFGAQFIITGDLQLQSSAYFHNYGQLNVGNNLTLNNNSFFYNKNKVSVNNQLQLNGGSVENTGALSTKSTTLNSGSYTNSCRMIAEGEMTNNMTLINNGMIWVKHRDGAKNILSNNNIIINGDDAVVKSVNFANNNTIRGSGYWYFTENTTTTSTVGVSGQTTDTLKIYDVTRTNPSRIFDAQWGTVHPNAVYRVFPAPDTINAYPGCSEVYKSGDMTLPVKWKSFSVKLQQYPLLNWSTVYEPQTRFEIERSYDNRLFTTISTIHSTTAATYSFSDATADNHQEAIYYRIKGISPNGTVSYSETKTVRLAGNGSAALSVYPNPSKEAVTIQYKSERSESIAIRISNAGGQQMLHKNVTVVKGMNGVHLSETAQLYSGIYVVELIRKDGTVNTQRLIRN